MNSLPWALSPFQTRRFLPEANLDAGDWSQLAPFFDRLEALAPHCATANDLEEWLFNWSELSSVVGEAYGQRHISMTCRTDDVQARQAYIDFVEQVLPQVETRQFRLAGLFRNHRLRQTLPSLRYEVLDRATAVAVELFREENVALETEEAKLGRNYDEIVGALSVQFRGEERTLPAVWKFLDEH